MSKGRKSPPAEYTVPTASAPPQSVAPTPASSPHGSPERSRRGKSGLYPDPSAASAQTATSPADLAGVYAAIGNLQQLLSERATTIVDMQATITGLQAELGDLKAKRAVADLEKVVGRHSNALKLKKE